MTDIIKRTTLMVRNAERAARWYESVFGLTRWMDVPFTLSGTQLAAGKKGDKTQLIIMQAMDDVIGMIGLLEWVDPKMAAPMEIPTRIAFGAPIFVVHATDCAGTTERARAAGSHIYCEPHDWSVTGADGHQLAMVGASFFDLDGYFYEVNQPKVKIVRDCA
jgi:catechol 2,3-dioxygenase-like lactoylglutathione lyase family enzyme